MAKTQPLNVTNPLGSSSPKSGDNFIVKLSLAVAELLGKDHYVGSTSTDPVDGGSCYNEDAAGEHSKVTLRETTKPSVSGETNKGFLYTKDVDGATELFYEDIAGNEKQLTTAGKVNLVSAEILGILANATYFTAKNAAGTSTVNLIKAGKNEADDAEVAILPDHARLATNAAPVVGGAEIANTKYVDDQISTYAKFGTSASRNLNAVYHAKTDGILVVITGEMDDSDSTTIKSDSNSSPSTVVAKWESAGSITGGNTATLTVPIKNGNYYQVVATVAVTSIYFTPIGS